MRMKTSQSHREDSQMSERGGEEEEKKSAREAHSERSEEEEKKIEEGDLESDFDRETAATDKMLRTQRVSLSQSNSLATDGDTSEPEDREGLFTREHLSRLYEKD
jgi:hypothetical protein